jgi:phosphoglycerate dehydrogenase-like enzyme
MKEILLTGAFQYSNEQIHEIESLGYNVTYVQEEREELIIEFEKFHVVVCNSLFLYNDISKFRNLEIIQLTSAGLDRVPLEYINNKGIKLHNAGNVYSIPMAEWALSKILEIYKKSTYFYENQKQKLWEKDRNILELSGKTVLIVGFGNVGLEVAKRLKSFDAYIIALDITIKENQYTDVMSDIDNLDSMLPMADIVILTLPLNEKTRHLFNENRLKKMKNNSVLINISRGGIIDESALIEFLKLDKFLGVALDVFEEEPLKNEILWNLKNIIITPHNSFISDLVEQRLFKLITKNIRM